MSRSFRHNKYEEDWAEAAKNQKSAWQQGWEEERNTLLDDSELSGDVKMNSDATGDLKVQRTFSSARQLIRQSNRQQVKNKKRADKRFRKNRRHDERD